MSTPSNPQASPTPQFIPPLVDPVPPKNGLGTTGFVLGLIGLLFSFIPVIGVVAWPLVILGIVFAALGLVRVRSGKATNKGLAIAGLALSVIGLIVCILWAAAVTKVAKDVNTEANRPAAVHYEVTGTATDATVMYSTFGDGNAISSQEQPKTLPWSKDLTTKGLIKGGSLTVTTGAAGGTVTCKVTVDSKEAKTATATGAFSSASCDGF